MSGLHADPTGKGSLQAARMAIEDGGGEVLGQPIELVHADHRNKADEAPGRRDDDIPWPGDDDTRRHHREGAGPVVHP